MQRCQGQGTRSCSYRTSRRRYASSECRSSARRSVRYCTIIAGFAGAVRALPSDYSRKHKHSPRAAAALDLGHYRRGKRSGPNKKVGFPLALFVRPRLRKRPLSTLSGHSARCAMYHNLRESSDRHLLTLLRRTQLIKVDNLGSASDEPLRKPRWPIQTTQNCSSKVSMPGTLGRTPRTLTPSQRPPVCATGGRRGVRRLIRAACLSPLPCPAAAGLAGRDWTTAPAGSR